MQNPLSPGNSLGRLQWSQRFVGQASPQATVVAVGAGDAPSASNLAYPRGVTSIFRCTSTSL